MRQCLLGLLALIFSAVWSSAWAAGALLADRHQARGAACASCHVGQGQPEPTLDNVNCLGCHKDRATLAKFFEKLGDRNPHANHLGEIDCILCHKGHSPSELYCVLCHKGFDPLMK